MKAAVCVLALLASAGHAVADDLAVAKQHAERAHRLYQLGRFDEATKEYEEAYLQHADPTLMFNIGQCHRQLHEISDALRAYKNYLQAKPDASNRAEVEGYIRELEATPPPAPVPVAPAPPPPPPQAAPAYAPVYVAVDQRRVMKQRVHLCIDGPNDWTYCNWKDRSIGENDFVRQFHGATGSARLDTYISDAYRRRNYIIVGGVVGGFALMTLIGGLAFLDTDSKGALTSGGLVAGLTLTSLGGTCFALASLIGWPLAYVHQPHGEHHISKEAAQHAVDEYNEALLRPYGQH